MKKRILITFLLLIFISLASAAYFFFSNLKSLRTPFYFPVFNAQPNDAKDQIDSPIEVNDQNKEQEKPQDKRMLDPNVKAAFDIVANDNTLDQIQKVNNEEYVLTLNHASIVELWSVNIKEKYPRFIKEFDRIGECDSLSWNLTSDQLINLRYVYSPCEAFSSINTYIFDLWGRTKFEMSYNSPNSGFDYKSDSDNFSNVTVLLDFNPLCDGERTWDDPIPKTVFQGIKLIDNSSKKEFFIQSNNKVTIECDAVYGGGSLTDPWLEDEPVYKDGLILVKLPSGEKLKIDTKKPYDEAASLE